MLHAGEAQHRALEHRDDLGDGGLLALHAAAQGGRGVVAQLVHHGAPAVLADAVLVEVHELGDMLRRRAAAGVQTPQLVQLGEQHAVGGVDEFLARAVELGRGKVAIQHGEVFVTDDGAETDLDLGHYERFIDESLTKNSNVTTGKVYWSVLQKERRGDFGGGTVQVIPHITNEIKSRFYRNFTSNDTHIAIIEVGGTVGDIESQPFLESIRQFQHEVGHENAILIHVTLIPYIKASGELKTKPTQSSVKELQGMGIQPDIIVCRSEHPLDQGLKDKIALFCNVPNDHVLQNLDVEYLYEAPLAMEKENLAKVACDSLHLP